MHLSSMADQLLAIFMFYSVKTVEEILTAGYTAFGHLVGEVEHEVSILLHERPEIHNTQLVI